MRFAKETTIKASPEQVFDYVADLSHHADWASEDLTVKQTSSGPVGVGSTFESVAHQFGTQNEKQTITEYSPGRRLAFESAGKLGVVLHAFDLSNVDGGALLTKSADFIRPSFMARLMTLMIGRQQPKALKSDVDGIKGHFEP